MNGLACSAWLYLLWYKNGSTILEWNAKTDTDKFRIDSV
jgi:hypothetical protein